MSRRNALDTICGWMSLHGIAGTNMIVFTTGRLTSEVFMKTALSGVSVVISHKCMTTVVQDLAEGLGMTVFGHAAKRRYICYAGSEHFDSQS